MKTSALHIARAFQYSESVTCAHLPFAKVCAYCAAQPLYKKELVGYNTYRQLLLKR